MKHLHRRAALRALGAGALLASAGTFGCTPRSRTQLKVILNWRYQGPHGWFFLAQDRGYFTAENLDVAFDQGDGSAAAVPKVASGAYDLGFGDINATIELAAQHPEDAPVGVYMLYNNTPFAIAVRADGNIRTPRDLEGRNLGGPANDGALKLFPIFCERANIDPSTVEVTILQPNLREQMLLGGQVDGVFGYQTTIRFGVLGLGANPETQIRWIKYADYGLDLYSNAIIASQRLVQEDPRVIRGFLRALNRGVRDTIADPVAAVAAVRRREPLINEELELQRLRATFGEMNNPEITQIGLGDVLDDRLQRSIATIAASANLANPPQLRQVFNRDFLPPLSERLRSLV